MMGATTEFDFDAGALLDDASEVPMMLMLLERGRQVVELGYDSSHDDAHVGGELAAAAACYAVAGNVCVDGRALWPWPDTTVPTQAMPELRRLAIAGALIVGEMARLLRAGADARTGLAESISPGVLDVLMSQPGQCRCIGCGCDDRHACQDEFGEPCGWLRIDRETGVGVCSECPDTVALWDRMVRVGDCTGHG